MFKEIDLLRGILLRFYFRLMLVFLVKVSRIDSNKTANRLFARQLIFPTAGLVKPQLTDYYVGANIIIRIQMLYWRSKF
jgi:hypothetical protein